MLLGNAGAVLCGGRAVSDLAGSPAAAGGGAVRDLRVGLVGAGGVGARHAATLTALDGVRLVAVTDVDSVRAGSLAHEHGARAHGDAAAMLAAEPLDAVWLCLPPFAHGECERAVLDAGVPFFVEKPLALDLGTAEEVAGVVEERGTVTGTGYHWRCMPGVERAAEILGESPVRVAHGTWWDKVPPVPWWLQRGMSGGQLVEQVTHLMDLMRFLVGEPLSVAAHPAGVPGRDPDLVDAATAATMRFDGGAVATLTATCLLTWKHAASLVLIGEAAVVEVGETETVIRRGDRIEVVRDDGLSKQRVDAEFCAAVRQGDPAAVRVPYAEALRTHRVGCALEESARSGTVVQLEVTVDA
jgi:myo-inositol 2-dehydrogenase/D-chiro-inositol 1-dehydrogenase